MIMKLVCFLPIGIPKEKKCYKKSRINCYSTEDMDYLIFLVLKLSIHRVQDIFHNHLLFL